MGRGAFPGWELCAQQLTTWRDREGQEDLVLFQACYHFESGMIPENSIPNRRSRDVLGLSASLTVSCSVWASRCGGQGESEGGCRGVGGHRGGVGGM